MDLSKRIQYNAEFPVVISPKTDDNGGVIFYVTSLQSKEIQKIERVGRNKLLAQKLNKGAKEVSGEMLDSAEDIEREKLINSVVRWEWNGNEFGDLGKDPEFTPENLAYVLDHDNSPWIVDKIAFGASDIANFTKG